MGGNKCSIYWRYKKFYIRKGVTLNEKGQWIEIDEFSKDGVKWFKYITMVLTE
jgi:hypothetical protein